MNRTIQATAPEGLQQCPLCGYRFTTGVEVCGSCGISGGCETVGCPHCGYGFPTGSVTVAFFKRIWHRLARRRAGAAGREDLP